MEHIENTISTTGIIHFLSSCFLFSACFSFCFHDSGFVDATGCAAVDDDASVVGALGCCHTVLFVAVTHGDAGDAVDTADETADVDEYSSSRATAHIEFEFAHTTPYHDVVGRTMDNQTVQ